MKVAYVDTSCLVAIALSEPGHDTLIRRLRGFDQLFAANLAEAELRSALAREEVEGAARLLDAVDRVYPDRALTVEYEKILERGRLKGADLFHIACALFLQQGVDEVTFVSIDRQQLAVAQALGM